MSFVIDLQRAVKEFSLTIISDGSDRRTSNFICIPRLYFILGININCKKHIVVVAILIFSRLTPIYVPKNYGKHTCPGFDPLTPM